MNSPSLSHSGEKGCPITHHTFPARYLTTGIVCSHPLCWCFLLILTLTIFLSCCQKAAFLLAARDNRHNLPASHTKSYFLAFPLPQNLMSACDQTPHHFTPENRCSFSPPGTMRKMSRAKFRWIYVY